MEELSCVRPEVFERTGVAAVEAWHGGLSHLESLPSLPLTPNETFSSSELCRCQSVLLLAGPV